MAYGLAMILVVLAVLVLGTIDAQQLPPMPAGCQAQVGVLIPCLPFVQGRAANPAQQCCSALGGIVNTNPLCVCALVNAGPGNNAGVNVTLALSLPTRCKMTGCSCTASLAIAPAPAPKQPADSAGSTPPEIAPQSPATSQTPSASSMNPNEDKKAAAAPGSSSSPSSSDSDSDSQMLGSSSPASAAFRIGFDARGSCLMALLFIAGTFVF